MQTVIVTTVRHETYTIFKVDEVSIAEITESHGCAGKYTGRVYGFSGFDGCNDGISYPDALEFVSDVIERRFARLGLEVEFK